MSQILGGGGSGGALVPANFADSPSPSVSLTAVPGVAITAKRSDEILALDQTAAYAFSGLGATVIAPASSAVNPLVVNAPTGFTGSIIAAQLNGVSRLTLSDTGALVTASTIQSGTNATISAGGNFQTIAGGQLLWAARGIITSPSIGTIQLGAANAASPVAQTLQSQGSRAGTDTNVAGSNLTFASGQGTGNSTGSSLIFQTPAAVASGTGAQTMTTRLTVDGTGLATFAANVSAAAFVPTGSTVPTNGMYLSGANTLAFSISSGARYRMISTDFFSVTTGGPSLRTNVASSTAPTLVPNGVDTNTGVGAQAAGNISLITGAVEIVRVTSTALTQIAGQTVLKVYTVATLPTGIAGGFAYVTDALAPTFLAAVVGGGTVTTPVFYNGTQWVGA